MFLSKVKKPIEEVIDRLSTVSSTLDDQSQSELAEEVNDCISRLKATLTTIINMEGKNDQIA